MPVSRKERAKPAPAGTKLALAPKCPRCRRQTWRTFLGTAFSHYYCTGCDTLWMDDHVSELVVCTDEDHYSAAKREICQGGSRCRSPKRS